MSTTGDFNPDHRYVISEVIAGAPPLAPSVELARTRTLAEIRDEATRLLAEGFTSAQLYLFNERSGELGLSAEWLEEWLAGTRKWPAE